MNKKYINFENDDSISRYFKDVRKTTLLTHEAEIELAKRIKDGDELAIEKLVKSNLKFVISIAKEYQGQGMPLSDLINEGNYGLIKAAKKFEYDKGFRFISYAVWWIKQSIIQSLNENARLVRLPVNVINKLASQKKEIEKFEFANERKPIYGELLDTNSEAIELLSFPNSASLNDVINQNGDELIELIRVEDEDLLVIDDRIRNELNNTLSILNEREKNIIECYFGLNTQCESMTLEAIGDKHQLTKERIRQIKEKSIRKIRNNAHNLYTLINE